MSVFGSVVSDLDPYLLRRWLEGDDSVASELVEGFWDRQYLRKFGLPRIPGIWWPPIPLPDPPPDLIARLHNEVSANILGALAGDPQPEPNRQRGRSLVKLLGNRKLRLASAKAIHERTLVALKELEAEIGDLSQGPGAASGESP